MRKLALLLSLLSTSTFAADLAKKPLEGYPYTACGLYFGLDTQAITGSTTQGEIGGLLGYSCPLGSSGFWFVEGLFNFANLNSTNGGGLNLTGPLSLEQRVGVGSPLSNLMGLFPSFNLQVPTLPVLPQGVSVVTTHPYIFAALHEQDISGSVGSASLRAWEFSPGVGLGVINQLSNAVALDVWAEAQLQDKAFCLDAVCQHLGTLYRVGLALKY